VFYDIKSAGQPALANWAEKTVKVKAGEKNKGLVASDTEPSRHIGTALLNNKPFNCKAVTIEAESQTEAAECIRAFYGQNTVTNLFMVALSSNLSESKPQV
jgi:hypothetical protein